MATAERGDFVKIYVTDSTTNVALSGQITGSWSLTADYIDSSAKGDVARTGLVGRRSSSISVEGVYNHSDTATQDLVTFMTGSGETLLTVGLYRKTGSTYTTYKSASGICTSLDIEHADNEVARYSATIEISGVWA